MTSLKIEQGQQQSQTNDASQNVETRNNLLSDIGQLKNNDPVTADKSEGKFGEPERGKSGKNDNVHTGLGLAKLITQPIEDAIDKAEQGAMMAATGGFGAQQGGSGQGMDVKPSFSSASDSQESDKSTQQSDVHTGAGLAKLITQPIEDAIDKAEQGAMMAATGGAGAAAGGGAASGGSAAMSAGSNAPCFPNQWIVNAAKNQQEVEQQKQYEMHQENQQDASMRPQPSGAGA